MRVVIVIFRSFQTGSGHDRDSVSPAKTAEQIEMRFGGQTRVAPPGEYNASFCAASRMRAFAAVTAATCLYCHYRRHIEFSR